VEVWKRLELAPLTALLPPNWASSEYVSRTGAHHFKVVIAKCFRTTEATFARFDVHAKFVRTVSPSEYPEVMMSILISEMATKRPGIVLFPHMYALGLLLLPVQHPCLARFMMLPSSLRDFWLDFSFPCSATQSPCAGKLYLWAVPRLTPNRSGLGLRVTYLGRL
jgi:hypothetical protein